MKQPKSVNRVAHAFDFLPTEERIKQTSWVRWFVGLFFRPDPERPFGTHNLFCGIFCFSDEPLATPPFRVFYQGRTKVGRWRYGIGNLARIGLAFGCGLCG